MLSAPARSLLGIPQDQVLPSDSAALYDAFFAGRSYQTRFHSGWDFLPRGQHIENGLDGCLSHLTAQFYFFLDSEFRVYVECSAPIQIASSFLSLVEKDAILTSSVATGGSRRGLGQFQSYDAFFSAHGGYVSGWREAHFDDKLFGRFLLGPASVIGLGRFYSDEYLINGIEYF